MFNNIIFLFENLQLSQKCVPLHRVFHSIRFKVNKRLEQGVAPFFLPFKFFYNLSFSLGVYDGLYNQAILPDSV